LSEARNQGVKYSIGEYITFVDSDDIVAPDYIEYLLYLIEKYGTEISVAGMQKFWDKIPGETNDDEVCDMQIPVSEALIQICYNKLSITAWGKLYRRDLVEKYPFPKGQLYEDTATTHKIVGDVPTIACGTKKIYYWRQRRNSITHANITRKHLFGITAAKEQIAYMQERYPEVVPAARVRCAMKIVDLAYRLVMGKMDRVLFEEIRNEIKPLCSLLWHDKRAGIALKIRSIALYWGIVPFSALSLIYTAFKKLVGKI
jgi:glycosyltransferase involved in cell wall biosynthesis